MTIIELQDLHRQALADAADFVKIVTPGDLLRPSPCSEWDLQALLGHMIGQNIGMAMALRDGDAPADAFRPRLVDAARLSAEWTHSATAVSAAVTDADPTQPIRLVEVHPDLRLPAQVVAGMHLLDTIAHTWDVAASLGRPYRPATELLEAFAVATAALPVETIQAMPNPVFAPPVPVPDSDPWVGSLARVGRLATPSGVWNKKETTGDVDVRDR